MAEIGNLTVQLGLTLDELQKGLNVAKRELENFGKQVPNAVKPGLDAFKKMGERMQAVGQSMSLFVTAPIVAGFGGIINAAGNFEAAMLSAGAVTQATATDFGRLEAEAKRLGATTSFSATEAAKAIETLGRNGLSATQILDGALESSLNLASATGTDLANAADIATDVMASFGKQAKDLATLIDGVSGVTLASKFTIDDYRLALGQAGGVAGQLGVSIEDFNTAIAATASSFASGSDAGTSFKTFLLRLNPASKEAGDLMKELGLQFFNADGSMKDLRDIAQELQTAFSGLTEAQKSQAAETIFGTDALRTALTLANQGAAGFDNYAQKIGQVSAAQLRAAREKGFNNALVQLRSALEGLSIAIANSGLLDFVTKLVQKFTGFIRVLSDLNPTVLAIGTVIAALVAAIGPLLLGIGGIISLIPTVVTGFAAVKAGILGITTILAANPFGALAVALGALASVVLINSSRFTSLTNAAKELESVNNKVADSVAREQAAITKYLSIAQNEKKTKEERLAAIRELNSISPEYLGNLNLETINTDAAKKATDAYIESLKQKARIQAAEEKLVEVQKKLLDLQTNTADVIKPSLWQNLANTVLSAGNASNFAARTSETLTGNLQEETAQLKQLEKELLNVIEGRKNLGESPIVGGTPTIPGSTQNVTVQPKFKKFDTKEVTRGVKPVEVEFELSTNKLGLQFGKFKQTIEGFKPKLPTLDIKPLADPIQEIINQTLNELDGKLDQSTKTAQAFGESLLIDEQIGILRQGIIDLVESGISPFDQSVTDLKESIEELSEEQKKLELKESLVEGYKDLAGVAIDSFSSIITAYDQIGTASEDARKKLAQSIKGIIKSFIAQGIAAIISNVLSRDGAKLGFLALPLAGAAGAAAAALFGKAVPELADGGVARGETLAIVGEYPGAGSNPELIAPASDMMSYIRQAVNESLSSPRMAMPSYATMGSEPSRVMVEVQGRIRGTDIELSQNRLAQQSRYNRG